MKIFILSDHSTRTVQATAVAVRLGGKITEISTLQIARSGWPDGLPTPQIIIGAGEAVAPFILQAKQKTGGKAVCILDPRQNHEQFDLLVLPEWEPLPNLPSIATISCLINHVTPELLAESPLPSGEGWVSGIRNDYALQPLTPTLSRGERGFIALLVGGRHVGGNITPDDVKELAGMLAESPLPAGEGWVSGIRNDYALQPLTPTLSRGERGLSSAPHFTENGQQKTANRFLISTSRRTEAATVAAIRRHFCPNKQDTPHSNPPPQGGKECSSALQEKLPTDNRQLATDNWLYDFNNDSNMGNPYLDFMAASYGIIVSGDSVRMVSEACSSGKPVWIWNPPSTKFNPYAKLHENLVAVGAARMFTGDLTPYAPNTLREADRIAAIIRYRLLS